MYKIIILLLLAFCVWLFTQQAEGEVSIDKQSASDSQVIVNKPTIKEYAEQQVLEVFGEGQWLAFDAIIAKESHNWTVLGAHYPSGYAYIKQKDGTYKKVRSSAWGLCGTLVNTHKVEEGFKEDPYKQIDWCIEYTKKFGNPQKALIYHLQEGHW